MFSMKNGAFLALVLVLGLPAGDACAAEPARPTLEQLKNRPHITGTVTQVQDDRLVVSDISMRIDSFTRIENARGVIQAPGKIQQGKVVSVWFRQSPRGRALSVRKLVLVK